MYQCSGRCMIICGLLRYVQVDTRLQSSIITLYLLLNYIVLVQQPVKCMVSQNGKGHLQLYLTSIAYYRKINAMKVSTELILVCKKLLV